MALTMALTGAVAAAAAAMYADARYHIRNDIAQIRGLQRAQKHVAHLQDKHGEDDWSFYHVLHDTFEINTDKVAFIFEHRTWTYRQLREDIGRCAHALQELGVRNRTVVAMFVNNSPEFMVAWWALYKIGAIPAPINTAISAERIGHCLRICEAEVLITTYELVGTVAAVELEGLPHLGQVLVYDHGGYRVAQTDIRVLKHENLPFTSEMADFPKQIRPAIGMQDAAQYLFTSGTTGLPKALIWPAGYCHMTGWAGRWPYTQQKPRRYYICLPLFHGTAAFAVLPATLAVNGTVTLARRFSRREFWADVRRSKSDGILYIGEMFRYLAQAPPDPRFPDEKDHGVEIALGLGLAPNVWRQVRKRFGIPWIVEYYSASEATVSLMNSNKGDFGVGKIAQFGPLMRRFGNKTLYIVKADLETEELVRDPETGFCIEVKPGEVGEGICRLAPPLQRRHDYVGQGGTDATEKKTLRDVFENGDMFYRLGDALMVDEDGYYTFRDRLGDTYRAKGHNISTTEVEGWLSQHPNISSVNVFGIAMNRHGYDGQLGCAAITLNNHSSRKDEQAFMSGLESWLLSSKDALPAYAVPRFVRILSDEEQMGNQVTISSAKEQTAMTDAGGARVSVILKKLKTGLRKEGFVMSADTKDRMYWTEKEGTGYVPLTGSSVQALLSGKALL